MANFRLGSFGMYYGSLFGESEPLSESEMKVNATYIYSYLYNFGWSDNAIAAILGNIQAESSMNPGRWQSDWIGDYSGGYGLVQWTPATKYIDWCSGQSIAPEDMDSNLSRILYEVENNIQWIETTTYPFTFREFTYSNKTVEELSSSFLLNYERPADMSESVQSYRASLSLSWYEFLTGISPGAPTPGEGSKRKKKKFNFILFTAQRRRNQWIKKHF